MEISNNRCDFSPCRKYRYTLFRIWDEHIPYVQFIGLNPSTADEKKNDPTVSRCVQYAKAWGYGGLCMTNLFAYRATDPKVMMSAGFPVGLENNRWLRIVASKAGIIVAAWGNHGLFQNRQAIVMETVLNGTKLHCLGVNKNNTPKHPLYLRKDLKPMLLLS